MKTTALVIATSGALACLAIMPIGAPAAEPEAPSETIYAAQLRTLNSEIAGTAATGIAHFRVRGDKLTIRIVMQGVPSRIEHWQHLHGFTDSRAASCPIGPAGLANVDTNHDGIIDLIETMPGSGTTLVPLNAKPVTMDIAANTYPQASAHGTYTYKETLSLKALQAAFAKSFNGASLDLDRLVVYVHGVPADTRLPSTVASLGAVPAHVTLPIACGKLKRASG